MNHKVIQVWFVVEYNDINDIKAGGSPWIGPYVWVPAIYLEDFLTWAKENYSSFRGKYPEIRLGVTEFVDELFSYDEILDIATRFLNDSNNWGCFPTEKPLTETDILLGDLCIKAIDDNFGDDFIKLFALAPFIKPVVYATILSNLLRLRYSTMFNRGEQ